MQRPWYPATTPERGVWVRGAQASGHSPRFQFSRENIQFTLMQLARERAPEHGFVCRVCAIFARRCSAARALAAKVDMLFSHGGRGRLSSSELSYMAHIRQSNCLIWHIQDSQGLILALAFRYNLVKPFQIDAFCIPALARWHTYTLVPFRIPKL